MCVCVIQPHRALLQAPVYSLVSVHAAVTNTVASLPSHNALLVTVGGGGAATACLHPQVEPWDMLQPHTPSKRTCHPDVTVTSSETRVQSEAQQRNCPSSPTLVSCLVQSLVPCLVPCLVHNLVPSVVPRASSREVWRTFVFPG